MSLSNLGQWFETPRGLYLQAWEQSQFDQRVADIFGFNAVQIGLCGQGFLRANRMPHRLHCNVCRDPGEPGALQAAVEELPFASQSLDLVILPHVLEFASHPHQVLREVERVLLPEGHLLVSGFNPLSLWGLRRSFSGHMGEIPWTGQYLSVSRLKDWLSLLGLEVHDLQYGCYAPPLASEVWLRRWSFMEAAGRHCWPIAGGAYVLHAVKRVQGLRLIMPRWRQLKASKKGMAVVTQKNPHQDSEWNM
ncbi:class I SAM-dependent methyltransferase [Uliginosibacterium aquaticum]|uniref:Class I SAM-dependent methyltransferase n=1 Tax=Uliginosibacterium aquaticum TaxID=2731212 RepID=A0ABX2IPX1_9RHOO|nr:class I SAM-dependent methyltransferase [Uliginosibacterium aquaticum]NSL56754.1 class I SAM-dependent methyltransferase [Uliginosibacterium aquaticum]